MEDNIIACLLGSALGDGFGWPTEFMQLEAIKKRWGNDGLTEPLGEIIRVTDDTQMALAVARAFMIAWQNEAINPVRLEDELIKEFITWLNDPENNRAPGMTCLRACTNLEKGQPWLEATVRSSKGCGANMRVIPVALMKYKRPGISDELVAQWAQFQAAITHANPTALAATELTAVTVIRILEGTSPDDLVSVLLDHCQTQQGRYHEDWLDSVWERPDINTPQEFINLGWQECRAVLEKVQAAVKKGDKITDPCLYTGDGWTAEEALATALLCFLYFPDDSVATLRRAVNTRGDSDSIACLAGGFAGARNGLASFPQDWLRRLEYQNELNQFLDFCCVEGSHLVRASSLNAVNFAESGTPARAYLVSGNRAGRLTEPSV
ncbi:MAG: ADP-ribosylglycohydrolase family protein [Bacteroidia bacterium]|nr:ADP-ribosylglycohydrolase family protein [Bacteroidia bacterium]